MNKKILISLSVIGVVAAIAVGGTVAYFSDTETSTGNTFTAGSIDLKVDSDCHYYNYVGGNVGPNHDGYVDVGCGEPGANGVGVGQWSETDLKNGVHKFFSFADIKPGDRGEDTISLHVYDNDAWGKISMGNMVSADNSCTEPEGEEEMGGQDISGNPIPGCTSLDGELLGAMLPEFSMCLDQGSIPGFQNVNSAGVPIDPVPDLTEGDNICQSYEGQSWSLSSKQELSDVLAAAYTTAHATEACGSPDGHDGYTRCHGLASDGRMVGSTTYYFALNWSLPWNTGNAVQTDSLSGDITFNVVQHRNNPTQSGL